MIKNKCSNNRILHRFLLSKYMVKKYGVVVAIEKQIISRRKQIPKLQKILEDNAKKLTNGKNRN